MAIFYTDSGSLNYLEVTGSVRISGSLSLTSTQLFNITGSVLGTSSWATNAITAQTASFVNGYIEFPNGLDVSGSLVVTGSSIVSGTFAVGIGGNTELQVDATGVTLGSIITDSHLVTGSVRVSGSITSLGTGSFGNLLPITDNTGVVGSSALTWANGQFTNLTVDTALTVGNNIQLGPSDQLRMGGATSFVVSHDGTNNYISSDESNLQFRDGATTRITLFRTTGAISASGGVTASGFFGTSSWAQTAVSSSFATTASFALNAGGAGTSGTSGTSGINGSSGTSGESGSSGTSGSSGSSGTSGQTGSSGTSGSSGSSGTSGNTGSSGTSGSSGSSGTSGVNGSSGSSGINGSSGTSGSSGSSGTSGSTGSSGTSGNTGSSGTSGSSGSSGTSGSTGSSGTSGNSGSSGTSGNTGSSGTSGQSGVTINNNTDNFVITATGTANTIQGESGLTYNGSLLSVTGNVSASIFSGSLDRFDPPSLRLTVGTTAPSSPVTNDLWVDTN